MASTSLAARPTAGYPELLLEERQATSRKKVLSPLGFFPPPHLGG